MLHPSLLLYTKNNSFLGNGINFNLGAYLPLYSFGPNNNFTLGPNIGASYFNLNGDVNATPKFNVTGQSSMPTATKSGNGNASGFTAEAGLHANFSFGKITISSILNVGYLGFQQDAFRVTQTNQANGNSYDNDLYSQKEIKENGFAFIPKLRAKPNNGNSDKETAFNPLVKCPNSFLNGLAKVLNYGYCVSITVIK